MQFWLHAQKGGGVNQKIESQNFCCAVSSVTTTQNFDWLHTLWRSNSKTYKAKFFIVQQANRQPLAIWISCSHCSDLIWAF